MANPLDPTLSNPLDIKGVSYTFKQGLSTYGSQQVGAWADIKPGQDPSEVMTQLQRWVLAHLPTTDSTAPPNSAPEPPPL